MEKNNMEKKEGDLEKMLYQVKPITQMIKEGDYITALFVIDNLQGDYKKDALYAGIALGMAGQMDEKGVKDGYALQLGQAL
ncbi:MAG: hypothetical protein ABIA37_04300, partial [Candidatus Woesearchaeota archaeon]